MEKKNSRITQYRERLDSTLTSPELTHKDKLKILINDQLRENNEALLEKRTVEVSDFLDMLRSASVKEHDVPECSETSHGSWKLKQDTEELRVMYREGPYGSPFHTLLAEGYVDGPLDACLCISWESALFKKWWPQYTIPAFNIISSKCVQKIRIGEQIVYVRMKVPWPLSNREAFVHYFEFEYFQDDLIVVLLNTIPDLERIDEKTHGFKKDGMPEAKDVVRIDVVGGFALQKVTAERSYFRTIANMDIKMDFIPPSLINFISRQLIGSSFKLFKKIVSSSFADEEYSKGLEDPLYARIRQALYSHNRYNISLKQKELEKETCTPSEEQSIESVQNDLDMDRKVQIQGDASKYSLGYAKAVESVQNDLDMDRRVQTRGDASRYSLGDAKAVESVQNDLVMDRKVQTQGDASRYSLGDAKAVESVQNYLDMDGNIQTQGSVSKYSLVDAKVKGDRTFGEIEEERTEESTTTEHCGKDNTWIHINEVHEKYPVISDRIAHISEEVQQALLMLDKAIYLIRENGLHVQTKSFSTSSDQQCPNIKDKAEQELRVRSSGEVCVEVRKKDAIERTAQNSIGTFYRSLDSRRTGSNSFLREINHNKIVPASPDESHLNSSVFNHIDAFDIKNGTTEKLQSHNHTLCNKHVEVTGDGVKRMKIKRQKKHWSCFPPSIFKGQKKDV